MVKVAIIGCGKIADAHAAQIQRIAGARMVGACDREPLMAKQLVDRFPVDNAYSDLETLLVTAKPDVVHITTPPESHFPIAKLCLERGVHVYIEKPVTVYAHETAALIDLATRKGLKLTAGHDDQFTHATRRMRGLVNDGYLGGAPVHMESYYCYDLTQPGYARALLGDKQHWVRRLPGKLLQNVISHGIARIAEFLQGDSPQVIVHGVVSPLLKRLGEQEIVDELRVIIADDDRCTAYFTFSSQMRPSLHHFRMFGPANGVMLDHDQDMLIRIPGSRYKSYAEKFVPHFDFARQHAGNLVTNVRLFLRRDFHMKSGMKFLMEEFYRSIATGTPLPISYREILLTAQIMESIFEQLSEMHTNGVKPTRMHAGVLESAAR